MDEYLLSQDDLGTFAGICKVSGYVSDAQESLSRLHDEKLREMGL